MRAFLMSVALVVVAAGGDPPALLVAHHRVDWGWGCGGNCAVNFSGESETTLGDDPLHARLEDHGSLTQRENHPGGGLVTVTRWKYAFHGTGSAGADRREYALRTGVNECSITREAAEEGKPATSKTARCPGAPKRWKLVCELRQVEVKGQSRPAWVCSPSPPMDAFGSEFPWVFGIEAPITSVTSGEPHPRTRYE